MQTNAKSFDMKRGHTTRRRREQQQHQQNKLKSKMQSERNAGRRTQDPASWLVRPWRSKTNESASILINYLNAAGMEMASSPGIKATEKATDKCTEKKFQTIHNKLG